MISFQVKRSCYAVVIALFGVIASLGQNEDALNVIRKNRLITVLVLLSSIALPIADTGSDILLTYEWLDAGPSSDEYWFGQMSLAIMIISTVIPGSVMLYIEWEGPFISDKQMNANTFRPDYLYHKKFGFFHPILGLFLSLTELRLPVLAMIQIYDITMNGVSDKYLVGPADVNDYDCADELRAMFSAGASMIMALRLFELLGETTLELLLQTCVPSSSLPSHVMFTHPIITLATNQS